MNTPDDMNDDLQRWMDGVMSAKERSAFEQRLETEPALRADADAMKRLESLLRENVSIERAVPNADFFNSQIQQQISEIQRTEQRQQRSGSSWLDWLRAPWLMAAGATALVVSGFFMWHGGSSPPGTEILTHYAPNPKVDVRAFHSADADATVLLLDGLDAFPADNEIAGLQVHSSKTDAELATTTLYNHKGDVLLVMTQDAAGRPQLMR